MSEHIQKKDIIKLLADKMKTDEETAELWIDTILGLITDFIRKGQCVGLKNFGRFYVKPHSNGTWAFKFNPSQQLRYFLGWSSTYKEK